MALSLLISALIFFCLPISVSADTPTTCYHIDGSTNEGAGYRCDNTTTGHSSCCQAGGICYSNGVCQQSNGIVQDYLRDGCTDPTWKDPACLEQCSIYAPDSTSGIRFCNGAITSTNQYCCDPGGTGIGSFACCNDSAAIFVINPIATVLAQIPLNFISTSIRPSSSSSSSSPSSSPSSAATLPSFSSDPAYQAATTTSATTPSAPARNSGGTGKGVAIGVGIAAPLAAIALGLVGFFLWRGKEKNGRQQIVELQSNESPNNHYADNQILVEDETSAYRIESRRKGYFGERIYDLEPQEMASSNIVHEMEGTTAVKSRGKSTFV